MPKNKPKPNINKIPENAVPNTAAPAFATEPAEIVSWTEVAVGIKDPQLGVSEAISLLGTVSEKTVTLPTKLNPAALKALVAVGRSSPETHGRTAEPPWEKAKQGNKQTHTSASAMLFKRGFNIFLVLFEIAIDRNYTLALEQVHINITGRRHSVSEQLPHSEFTPSLTRPPIGILDIAVVMPDTTLQRDMLAYIDTEALWRHITYIYQNDTQIRR